MDKANALKAKRKRKKDKRLQKRLERLGQKTSLNILPNSEPNMVESNRVTEGKRKMNLAEKISRKKRKKHQQLNHSSTNISSQNEISSTKKDDGMLKAIKPLSTNVENDSGNASKNTLGKNAKKNTKPKNTSPIVHKGRFVFSRFDFLDADDSKSKGTIKQKGKDYRRLLENVQKRSNEIEEINKKDARRASELQNKYDWKVALARASGEKVKNDEDLLKKALKKKEYRNKKLKKDWDQRKETVHNKMKQRQKKRTDNIKKKKEGRINKKIKKARKKGRIAGF